MLITGLGVFFRCGKQSVRSLGELTGQTAVTSLIHEKFTVSVCRKLAVKGEFAAFLGRIKAEQVPEEDSDE